MKTYFVLVVAFLVIAPVKADESQKMSCTLEKDELMTVDMCFKTIKNAEAVQAAKSSIEVSPLKGLSFDASAEDSKAIVKYEGSTNRSTFQFSVERSFEDKFESAEYLNLDGIPSETKALIKWGWAFQPYGGTSEIDVTDQFKILEQNRKKYRNALCSDQEKADVSKKDKCEFAEKAFKDFFVKRHHIIPSDEPIVTWFLNTSLSYLQTPHKHFDLETSKTDENNHNGFEFTFGLSRLSSEN
jgi:hypothetical protein